MSWYVFEIGYRLLGPSVEVSALCIVHHGMAGYRDAMLGPEGNAEHVDLSGRAPIDDANVDGHKKLWPVM